MKVKGFIKLKTIIVITSNVFFLFNINNLSLKFYYLKMCKNISDVRAEIKQNNIEKTEYNQKIDNFIQAIEEKREKDKTDILYDDSINI